ncbi:PROTEASE M50 MEMBRANE-BOUND TRANSCRIPTION FACTOR SITE 2 PROTEASE [Salix viminalis]|uniref:Endopeptidase S2P n=1 Tax=Salix viminalis TaxID=40686 RepID=A0A9Q0QAZ4_SALVM|nr:PROTEASE M50 MEMBRANE-BOUND TRANSCRIPTION FACTOR SITE 2 PROTEASE [Salix viminalis]
MDGRRWRRHGRGQAQTSFLPLRAPTRSSRTSLSNTVSCCYCDYKISALNTSLYHFGRKQAKLLKIWFSIGVGFSLTALLGVTLILVWEFGNVYGSRLSVSDAGYLLLSTLISVSVHEFGHSIAAASEGIPTEYIAIFLAVLFPGALVALSYELLEELQPFAALRVYCAGVWHNAVCCAPHGFGCTSYLSFVGLSVSWGYEQTLQSSNLSKSFEGLAIVHRMKGYCVPTSVIEESKEMLFIENQSACPDDLTGFVAVQCFNSSKSDIVSNEDGISRRQRWHCLNARDVVKLNKCGDGWVTEITKGSSCLCSQEEYCLSPVPLPGSIWVEITFASPYSPECLQLGRNSFPASGASDVSEHKCGGTFVFVGDLISMAHSVRLTAYQPRWGFSFSAHLPNILEKSLMCTFHVSLTLALLNSLPGLSLVRLLLPVSFACLAASASPMLNLLFGWRINFGGSSLPLHIIEPKEEGKSYASLSFRRDSSFHFILCEDLLHQFLVINRSSKLTDSVSMESIL